MLMYGIERWVVTGEMLKIIEGFHHRADRRIMGIKEKPVADREWEYLPVMVTLEEAR